jgi:hypothetical protein
MVSMEDSIMSKLTRVLSSSLTALFTLGLLAFGHPAMASYDCELEEESASSAAPSV